MIGATYSSTHFRSSSGSALSRAAASLFDSCETCAGADDDPEVAVAAGGAGAAGAAWGVGAGVGTTSGSIALTALAVAEPWRESVAAKTRSSGVRAFIGLTILTPE